MHRTLGLVRNLAAAYSKMLVPLHSFPVLEDLEKPCTSAWVMLSLALKNHGRFPEVLRSEASRTTFQTIFGRTYLLEGLAVWFSANSMISVFFGKFTCIWIVFQTRLLISLLSNVSKVDNRVWIRYTNRILASLLIARR